jgi:hypothetical protein
MEWADAVAGRRGGIVMSHRDTCPDRWTARREGERAQESGYASFRNPYDDPFSRDRCEEAADEWRRGYRSAEIREEERREEEAARARAERRRIEEDESYLYEQQQQEAEYYAMQQEQYSEEDLRMAEQAQADAAVDPHADASSD